MSVCRIKADPVVLNHRIRSWSVLVPPMVMVGAAVRRGNFAALSSRLAIADESLTGSPYRSANGRGDVDLRLRPLQSIEPVGDQGRDHFQHIEALPRQVLLFQTANT